MAAFSPACPRKLWVSSLCFPNLSIFTSVYFPSPSSSNTTLKISNLPKSPSAAHDRIISFELHLSVGLASAAWSLPLETHSPSKHQRKDTPQPSSTSRPTLIYHFNTVHAQSTTRYLFITFLVDCFRPINTSSLTALPRLHPLEKPSLSTSSPVYDVHFCSKLLHVLPWTIISICDR
ncbi:hypothetical protein B0O99DRAFT_225107 [Bisporella sp. PMI_857]|nr:hypothetical protein B0O99DRAFT_225107 [Bisporella sp. PMI_857]